MTHALGTAAISALLFLSSACGSETAEEPGTTPTTPTDPAEEPSTEMEVEVGNVPRILGPNEVGEDYLRYAASSDPRIQQTVRCDSDPDTASGSALRPTSNAGELNDVQWVHDTDLPSSGEGEGITQLRYRANVTEGENTQDIEGVLTLKYDDESRSYYVACPEPTP